MTVLACPIPMASARPVRIDIIPSRRRANPGNQCSHQPHLRRNQMKCDCPECRRRLPWLTTRGWLIIPDLALAILLTLVLLWSLFHV